MVKKRLIGVVTVKDGWAIQSFGYRRYLPLGRPEQLVENLDRWGADEIFVQVIDRSKENLGPDFALINRLGSLGLGTPLIYGGGISSLDDGVRAIQSGADRICIDSLLRKDIYAVHQLAEHLGSQALIASIPLDLQGDRLRWYDYQTEISTPLAMGDLSFMYDRIVSEVLIVDWQNEGYANRFTPALIDGFNSETLSLIAFGGISSSAQIRQLLNTKPVVAVAIGNFLSYQEHAVQQLKNTLTDLDIRHPTFAGEYPLVQND